MSTTAGQVKEDIQTLLGVKADRDIGGDTRARFELLAKIGNDLPWPPILSADIIVATVAGVDIYKKADGSSYYWYSKASIDADGAPTCYHPDSARGLDNLVNAGRLGNWYGIVTDTDHISGQEGKGKPYIQGVDGCPSFSEETKGFFVSATAFADNPEFPLNDQRRYTNALEVRYIVIPGGLPFKIRMNSKAQVTWNNIMLPGITADVGGKDAIGELSLKYAKDFGMPGNARAGGVPNGVRFEVFI